MSKHLSVSYSKAGDLLKVYWDDAPSFADTPPAPRDDVILLRALGDETRIVGCKIVNLSEILDRAGLKLVPKKVPPTCPKHNSAMRPDWSCGACATDDLLD